MYSHETGRVKGLDIECLESRIVPAAFGVRQPLNSLLSVIQFASDTANTATTGAPARPGSLAAVGQAAKAVLADGVNLATDAGALAIDGAVLAEETGLLTAGASNPATLTGALLAIVKYEQATQRNVVGTAADAALLTNYVTAFVQMPNLNNGISVAIQTGVVASDILNNSVGAVVTDTLAVIQDAVNLYQHAVALNTAVQQFGGYTALANVGLTNAASLISSSSSALGNLVSGALSDLKGYTQGLISDAKQAASALSNEISDAEHAFANYVLSLINLPPQTTGAFDPDNDDDDDTGEPGY